MNQTETLTENLSVNKPLLANLKHIPLYLSQPIRLFQNYKLSDLQPDLIAGLTVAVIALPQAIAFALIAELPPAMGLYAVIIGALIGGLWGSCYQLHSGPANAISILVLSVLVTVATPATPEFLVAAGVLAVLAGLFQLTIGLTRIGMLVNFVSHSVIIGFSAGAGILIVINQLPHLLGLHISKGHLLENILQILIHLPQTHWLTTILGLATIGVITLSRKFTPKLPSALVGMVVASVAIFILGNKAADVSVIGQLTRDIPYPIALPLFDWELISQLTTGALAVALIGLIQTTAIGRSISAQTGQRLDSNQEFVGQGLANIASGFFAGYAGAGSFSRSAVNLEAGAKTPMSALFSSAFVLIIMIVLAPLGSYVPRSALAAVLVATAFGLIDQVEIVRIWHGTLGDTIIMLVTLLATLLLPLQFAVLVGVLFSFARYIIQTSVPRVYPVVPDKEFGHFLQQQSCHVSCTQLGIIRISGDLYFGAGRHVEETIHQYLIDYPQARFLLLRMQGVNHCDFRGVQVLRAILQMCQDRGGDLFLMKVQKPVYNVLKSAGFSNQLGRDHFLEGDFESITKLFLTILDPAICIYECKVRAFLECQNLPKQNHLLEFPEQTNIPLIRSLSPQQFQQKLRTIDDSHPLVIDVREPREFKQGHISQAQSIPLPKLLTEAIDLPYNKELIVVCRSGQRSIRAAHELQKRGYHKVYLLQGGMLAWQATGMKLRKEFALS